MRPRRTLRFSLEAGKIPRQPSVSGYLTFPAGGGSGLPSAPHQQVSGSGMSIRLIPEILGQR